MKTFRTNPKEFEDKAEILKAISNPSRLCIAHALLTNGACNVSDMQNCLDKAQSTVSQHVSKLKSANIITGERRGKEIYYSLKNEDVKKIIEIFFKE
ncbi:MAG: metalloregulator ArsR/SmtB family transcription factor [Bacillota bacterium]|nr:metalloregulator ArsR/SmtB family transcription factor [Bacillota bacterium]